MFSRRNCTTWLALVAMLVSVVSPAVAQCASCSRPGLFNRSVTVESSGERDGLFRGRLFAGRVFDGDGRVFRRASYGSSGGQGHYEASCGQAAEAACGASSNEATTSTVEEANDSYTVPSGEFSQLPPDGSWRPPVAIRTVRVISPDLFTTPPATLLAAK